MMKIPGAGDFIDIHNHEAKSANGIFAVDIIMVHEERVPEDIPGIAFCVGIHPWFLNETNLRPLIGKVSEHISHPSVIGVGEAGFDKLKGPPLEIQRIAFEEQVAISEKHKLPLIIHCVRAWDELLMQFKRLKPVMPWLVHGYRGNRELAMQLINKGMFLSFWFDFVVRPESSTLIRSLPTDRIFLETDGANVDIKDIYSKVSTDLGISIDALKDRLIDNYNNFFCPGAPDPH